MTTAERPDITCTKCMTVVSWRPHCPHCRAYLEFSGNPPWHPDDPVEEAVHEEIPESASTVDDPAGSAAQHAGIPEGPLPTGDTVVADSENFADSGYAHEAAAVTVLPVSTITTLPPEVDEADAIADAAVDEIPETPKEPGAFTLIMHGLRRDPDRHVTGYLAAITLAIIVIILFGAISGPVPAALASPLFIGWALASIAIFGTIPDQREFEIAEAEEARRREAEEQERLRLEREAELRALAEAALLASQARSGVGTVQQDEDPIEARAPQLVASTVEKSAPMKIHDVARYDTACEDCGRMNQGGRRFCEQCGAILGDAIVAPTVVALSQAELEKAAAESKKKKVNVSSSWRTPIMVFAIVGVVIGALAFAFFGPGAFQLRFGTTRAFQIINQWIDPYSGKAVSIETVEASSTLPGSDPQQIATADARTFWASAPSPNYGAGSVLTYTLANPTEIDRMVIFPGIQSAQFDSRALASPKDITLTFDDGTVSKATLASLDIKTDSRQLVSFPQNVTQKITLTINTVYPPRGAVEGGVGEVAISGTQFLEVPQPPKVFGFQNGTRAPVLPGSGTTTQNQGQ